MGDKQGAIADYSQAIQIEPKLAKAYAGRGIIHRDLGNKEEAIIDFHRSAELFQHGDSSEFYQSLWRIMNICNTTKNDEILHGVLRLCLKY